MCRFCRQAVNAEAARTAIPCAHCRMQNRWGRQKCIQCQHWIVVSCVFCGALSPHNCSNCMRCNEAFAGAAQRKQQAEQQRAHHQNMQSVGVWGNVAAAFAGAAVGSAVTHSWGHHSYSSCSSYDSCSSSYDSCSAPSVDTFDISGVSDDTGFDFGGD
jgi:hypothetical protein